MLERIFRRKPVPLTGAPPVRRLKTYSAQSGYVYQYFYLGHRPASHGTEYCFDVSADRKTSIEVCVVVPDAAVAVWERTHGRAMIANERYAAAKMTLFQAFDDRAPDRMQESIEVRPADLEAIMTGLGLD